MNPSSHAHIYITYTLKSASTLPPVPTQTLSPSSRSCRCRARRPPYYPRPPAALSLLRQRRCWPRRPRPPQRCPQPRALRARGRCHWLQAGRAALPPQPAARLLPPHARMQLHAQLQCLVLCSMSTGVTTAPFPYQRLGTWFSALLMHADPLQTRRPACHSPPLLNHCHQGLVYLCRTHCRTHALTPQLQAWLQLPEPQSLLLWQSSISMYPWHVHICLQHTPHQA